MKNLLPIVVGIVLIVLGIINISGNISTIHWYNRTRVQPKDEKKYGKVVGMGTVVIGLSTIISYILTIALNDDLFMLITLLGAFAGLVLILYAQFKYNKGIF